MRGKTRIICGIYCIENIFDNRKYVGYAKNIKRRWNHHKNSLKNNKHENEFLQRVWNKYGEKNFIWYILEECEESLLIEKEKYYIKVLKTRNIENGYNLNDGGLGNLGWEMSDEIRLKKSNSVSGKLNPMFGRKHSQKTSEILSEQRIGNKNGVGNKNNLGKVKKYKNSTSKYYGVTSKSYIKKDGSVTYSWFAYFSKNSEYIRIGTFGSEIEAAKAWDKESWSYYKDIKKLNFPEDYYDL